MKEKNVFKCDVLIRWNDFDRQGMVNNAKYLTYLEEAHLEFFKAAKLNWKWGERGLVVANSNITFKIPIQNGDAVEVYVSIEKLGNKSIQFNFLLCEKNSEQQIVFASASLVLVLFDFALKQTTEFTEEERQTLNKYLK